MEHGNVSSLRDLNANQVLCAVGFVILLQPLPKVSRVGPDDVVLPWVEVPAALEYGSTDLVLRDARHSVIQRAPGTPPSSSIRLRATTSGMESATNSRMTEIAPT